MFYAAVANLNPGTVTIYEGETLADVATKMAAALGGHYALEDEDRHIPVYSGKAYISRSDGDQFWQRVMSDVMEERDNEDLFYGEDRASVVAEAEAFIRGELAE